MATACPPGEDTPQNQLTANLDVTTPCSPEEIFPEARCAVCEGPFRLPKLLDCLHSVCEPCVKRCLSAGEYGAVVVCPVKDCSEQTCIPQGLISALPTNYLLLPGQQSVSGACFCSECVDEEEAESYCEECGVFLCSFHVLSHRKSRSTTQHALQEIDRENDASQRTRGPQQRRILCPFHGEDMSLFCCTCDYLCCSQCTRGGHREHNVEPTSEVSAGVMADFREMLMEIKTATNDDKWTVEEVIEEGNQKLDEIEDQAEATSKQIAVRIGEVKMALEEKERCLLQRVDTLKNHRECELEQSLDCLQKTSLTFKVAVETAEKALAHLAQAEQLSLAPVFRRRLSQAQTDVSFAKGKAAKIVQKDEKIKVSSTALPSEAVIQKIKESFPADEIRSDDSLVDGQHTTVESVNHINRLDITCRNRQKKKLYGAPAKHGLDLTIVMPSGKPLSHLSYEIYPDEESESRGEVGSAIDAVTSHQTQDPHIDLSAKSDQEISEDESNDGATHQVIFEPEEVGLHMVRLNYEEGINDGTVLHRFEIVNIPAMQFNSVDNQGSVTSDGTVMTFKGQPGPSVGFIGCRSITSGVLSWRVQLWGLSSSSILSFGICEIDEWSRMLDCSRIDECPWMLDCSAGYVAFRETELNCLSKVRFSPCVDYFPKLQDGDILFCWLCWSLDQLCITHEASGVSAVVTDMLLTGREVCPCVIMSSPKHRVVSVSPGLLNEEISEDVDSLDSDSV